jgi:(p)ppGpp synthase/HD superfamily hydrolase
MNSLLTNYSGLFGALKLAAVYHANQKRKSDELPYVSHLIDVAHILVEIGNISCEDKIEDTDIDMETLRSQVSKLILSIILELTEDKKLPRQKRREETIRKLNLSNDATKRVKLADICSNIVPPPMG